MRNRMHVGLIGMSCVGKTYWAQQLAPLGFECLHCDDLLAVSLGAELQRPFASLYDIGAWLGFPYEAGYREREDLYVRCETTVLHEIIATRLQSGAAPARLVIDMGGSSIYAGAELFARLRQFATIVYLALSEAAHGQMLMDYLEHPRPLIWRGLYSETGAEGRRDALARCYARLIRFREQLYAAYSDIRIDYDLHRSSTFTASAFLAMCATAESEP
jgi:shikimate kinase